MDMTLLTKESLVMEMINNPSSYAAIYARESNPQVDTARDTQIIICEKFASDKNLIVYDTYSDLIPSSKGSYKNREGFGRLLEDAHKGYFKNIIVTRRDRLTRVFEEFIELKNIFKKLDIRILYSNDVQFDDKRNYSYSFIENMIVAMAELEPKNIKDRINAGKSTKILNKKYDKKAPYGMFKDTESKLETEYYGDGTKQHVVKNIFDIYSSMDDVHTAAQIKEQLYKCSFDDSLDIGQYRTLLNDLTTTDIRNIISRPVYAGLMVKNIKYKYKQFKVYYDEGMFDISEDYFQESDSITPLIEPKLWYKVTEKWLKYNKPRKKQGKRPNYLPGYLRDTLVCCTCNTSLKPNGNYFKCTGKTCKRIGKDRLTRSILEEYVKWSINNKDVDEHISKVLDRLKKKQNSTQKAIERFTKKQSSLLEETVSEGKQYTTIKKRLIKNHEKQRQNKETLELLQSKIHFVKYRLKQILIPLLQSDYMSLLFPLLYNNEDIILGVLRELGHKEVNVDGRIIRIGGKRKDETDSGSLLQGIN